MNIEVISAGKRHHLQAEAGKNLMDCLLEAGLMEGSECGGRGVCGKCAVKVHSGELAPAKPGENARYLCKEGEVLACRSLVKEDVIVELGSGRDDVSRKVRLPNLHKDLDFDDPPVKKVFLQMTAPNLHDQLSDLERIQNEIGKDKRPAYSMLHELPNLLRDADFKVTAVLCGDELMAVEPGDTTATNYGFIVDVGTTTVAIYLVDMLSGDAVEAAGIANPQRGFGADVLSRISAAATPEDRKKIQNLTMDGIGQAMREMMSRAKVDSANVYHMMMVGNTTMSHLFLGVDPANLAVAPFVPGYRPRMTVKAVDLGLPLHPEAQIHVLGNISGYVGSDTLGVAMATRIWELDGCSVAVDIGTNGEILLGYQGKVWACSAAAGPAFEGAHIEQGMRAGEGAIEKVNLDNDTVTLSVIGKKPAQGICGSGLIDAVAELVRVGLIQPSGRFATERHAAFNQPLASRLRDGKDGVREFVLAYASETGGPHDVAVTQKDIRELQLAKAAIAAGIEILLKEAGIDSSKVDRLFLAGAFGNYLDKEKAVALGLFPGVTVDKIIAVGNAAAEGAGRCLLSVSQRDISDRIAMSVVPIELSTREDFNDLWVKDISFPAPEKKA